MIKNKITQKAEKQVTDLYLRVPRSFVREKLPDVLITEKDAVLMFIPRSLDAALLVELCEYMELIRIKYGKKIYKVVTPHTDYSPEDIRDYINDYYDRYRIDGSIFVGQWNVARWVCTRPNGNIRSGPLSIFYSDLDLHFYRDESDPAIEGLESTYNRVDRFDHLRYPHANVAYENGEVFRFGSELWCVFWRATGVHNPKEETDDQKEIDQLSFFMKKAISFHEWKYPYFYRRNFLLNQCMGMFHSDYAKQGKEEKPGSSAYCLEKTRPGRDWYKTVDPLCGMDFIKKYRAGSFKRCIFDVWTHAGPISFYPKSSVAARDVFYGTEPDSGFMITPIFGCSSGVFEYCEAQANPNRMYNYALSLLMSKGIDLFTIGTPWSIGFGHHSRDLFFDRFIRDGWQLCDVLVNTESQATYKSWKYYQDSHEIEIKPFLHFGDPFLKVEF